MNRVSRTTPSYHYRQSCFLKHLIQIGRNQSERARLDLKNLPALCAQIRSFAPLPRTANFRLIPGCKDRRKMMPRKIGYARVSALHQSLDRQIAALRAEGCDRIFREKASGKSTKGRPELDKAIDALGTGVKFGRKPKLSAFQRDEVGRRFGSRRADPGPCQVLQGQPLDQYSTSGAD
jgi:hypothetical protein